jgi:hypothetical protein
LSRGEVNPLPLSLERRDYYTEFIEGSRWLRREHAQARANWFEGLILVDKEHLLFEYEMLLKGMVCFGNPVNHPGPPVRGEPAVSRPFKAELAILREIMRRVIEVGRRLTVQKGKSMVFQRYLESVIAQDEARFKMVKHSLHQDDPPQSVALMVAAFTNLSEVAEGLLQLPYVSYRLFLNVVHMTQREIHRSTFFDPLAALEFRAEFDRITPKSTLNLIRNIESEPARRVMSLTFLSLYRILRYIMAIRRSISHKVPSAVAIGWLAVLRSDTRALTIFLKRESARWLSEGFYRLYEGLGPHEILEKYSSFEDEFHQLRNIKELLTSIGDQLRLEQVKAYEYQLPAIAAIEGWEHFKERAVAATQSLNSFIQNAAVMLAKEFDPRVDGAVVFPDFVSEQERSDRLRRDIWMFQKVLRAFIEKTKGSFMATDQWSKMSNFRFVREFVGYFRSMGYQLLRYSDYEAFDKFMDLVDRLREGDVLEVQRISNVIKSCEDFMSFLDQTFEAVGQREELVGVPFDKREAARTLKLFLKK